MNNEEIINQLQKEKDMVLKISSNDERKREKALAETLSAQAQEIRGNIQARREERYQEMIDELPPVESPMSRKR